MSAPQTDRTPLPGVLTPEAAPDAPTEGSEGRSEVPGIGCSTCPARWSGSNTCHCGGCHLTFTSLAAFDRHRRGGVCTHPASLRTTDPATGKSRPDPLVLAAQMFIPANRHTGYPAHYRDRGYEAWSIAADDA